MTIENKKVELPEDGTPAAASITAHGAASKSALMAMTVANLANLSHEDMTKWFEQAMAIIGTYGNAIPDGTAAKNASTIVAKGAVKEDVEALFSGEEISEDFREKAITLFEAAINARLVLERAEIEEQAATLHNESVAKIKSELEEKIDEYLDYAAHTWVEENKVAIENALKVELVDDFMKSLQKVFKEHYVEIPDDKLDVLAGLSEQVEDLTAKVNESIEANIALKKENEKLVAEKALADVAEGLVLTDREKFKTLSESVEFTGDVDTFKKKLSTIREHHFKKPAAGSKPAAQPLTEETVEVKGDVDGFDTVTVVKANPQVSRYADAISRTARK